MSIKVGDALFYLGINPGNFHQEMAKVKDAEEELKKKNKEVADTLKAVGAAFTAVGAGGLLMAASTRKINAELGSMAITLGSTKEELRDMVLGLTDADTGVKEVVATLNLLARAGVRNKEDLKASTTAFDALADATEDTADGVAGILIPAYKALGLELPKTVADMDKFTYLVKNTTTDLSQFGQMMSYVAVYGQGMTLSMEDAVAVLAALAAKGKEGEAATRMFRSAINSADGDVTKLYRSLGITQTEIEGYKQQIQGATGLTQKHADEMNKSVGIMDRLKSMWEKLSLVASPVTQALEPVFALLTALGPIALFFSTAIGLSTVALVKKTVATIGYLVVMGAWKVAMGLATAAQWALNVAMTANPIGVIIVAVAALTAGIIALAWWLGKLIGAKKEDTLATMGQTKAEAEHAKAVKEAEDNVKHLGDEQEQLNKLIGDAKTKYQAAQDASAGYASAIAEQEHQLSNTNYALDQAKDKLSAIQKSYDAAADKVKGFEDAITNANSELDKLSNPKLQGMQAFDDRIQGYQLQLNDLNVTLAGQKVAGKDTTDIEASIAYWENLKSLAEAEKTAAYDNQLYLIKQSTDAAQGLNEEMSMSGVTGGIAEWAGKLTKAQTDLAAAKTDMAAQNGLLTTQQQVVDGLTEKAKAYQDVLALIKNTVENTLFLENQSLLALETKARLIQELIDAAAKKLADLNVNVNAQGQLLPPPAEGTTSSKDAYWIEYFKRIAGGENLPPPSGLSQAQISYYQGLASGKSLPPLASHAGGGWIAEPSLITRLRDMKPIGTMSERGPEYINPNGQGSLNNGQRSLNADSILNTVERSLNNMKIGLEVFLDGGQLEATVSRLQYRQLQERG